MSLALRILRFFIILVLLTNLLLGVTRALAAFSALYWQPSNSGIFADTEILSFTPTLTLFSGTWGNGIYRSTDNGASWITSTNGVTLPMYVKNGLAVNPISPTILFVGDYYGGLSGVGVYRSLNGGDSWAVSLQDANIETLLVHPLTPTLVFAGDRENGLYRSDDNGDTWQQPALPASRVQALAASSLGPTYAGADKDLYLSATGGVSWTLASTLSSTITSLVVQPFTSTIVYAGTRNHGVWRSMDGGHSWITATTGLPANAWVTSITIHPVTTTILYVGVWSGQVYRSEDGGSSWTGLGYLGTVQSVVIHPQAPSVIYAATSNNGVFRGSTLDHIALDPISTTQYAYRPFTLTITAHDELGFPLSAASLLQTQSLVQHDARLANTLASGYNGSAILTDTVGLVTPTTVNLINGVGSQSIVFKQSIITDTITATLQSEGLQTVSDAFEVRWYAQTYLPLIYLP